MLRILSNIANFIKTYIYIFKTLKALLHSPWTHPALISQRGFALTAGFEALVSLHPSIIWALDSEMADIPLKSRQCLLDKEKKLQSFVDYDELNCWTECVANVTLNVRFFF